MTRPTLASAEQDLLARVCAAVRVVEPGARVILYGSRARGAAAPNSDWDLLVLLDGPVDERRRQAVQQRLWELTGETGESLQAVVLSREEWDSPRWRVSPFRLNVEDDGVDLAEPTRPRAWRTKARGRRSPPTEEKRVMAEAREELVRDWLREAHEALTDAEVLAREGRWKSCVSRLYYACFYAVQALLLARGYRFSKHGSVHSLLNRHFVHAGIVPPDLGVLYNTLFTSRLQADYNPSSRFDPAAVQRWLADSRRLIAFIEALLADGARA